MVPCSAGTVLDLYGVQECESIPQSQQDEGIDEFEGILGAIKVP